MLTMSVSILAKLVRVSTLHAVCPENKFGLGYLCSFLTSNIFHLKLN